MTKRIRFVPQTAAADCGAACLAMSLGVHGRNVPLEDVRRVTGMSRLGVDAQRLVEAAEHFGLRARGVQLRTPADLVYLEPGSILHWEFRHFVVLERAERTGAWIVDPGSGRRFVSRAELDRAITGVALVLEPGPDFEPGGSERTPLLGRYLKRVFRHNTALVRVVLVSILLQFFALAVPILTGLLIDRVIPRGDHRLYWILAGGAAALVGFSAFATFIRGHILLALRTRLDAQLTTDFLEHLVHLPFSFFQQRSAGDLMMRVGSNATIREILTSAVLSGALDGLMVVSYLALLLFADIRLGFVVTGLALLRVAVLAGALRRRQRLSAEALTAQAAAQSYEIQMLHGIEALKACGAEQRAVDSWSHLFVRQLNVGLARGRLDVLVNSLIDGLSLASPVIVLLYGGARVMAGDLTLGTMFALAALSAGFLAPLSALVVNASQFQLLGSYLERLDDVLSTPGEPQGRDLPRPESFAGLIAAEELSFRYSPLVPPAIAGASFDIEPGSLLAIVGPSGSGKSTLTGLIAGLLTPESGRLLYDGRPLEQFPREWLRSRIAYLPQHSYLFGTSIRANIALQDPNLPFERVVEAAKLAEIHDEITQLPMGYETVLADAGASLSGGQRQRIALARALVGRPKVLILDEATSALDAVTEQKIQRNLRDLRATRIVAAHRLSTTRDADRILVLDRGHVVDAGSHDELVSRDGLYRQLVSAQLESADVVTPLNPRAGHAPIGVEARLARITAFKGDTP
jgi:ATP-binding cassette subfamily B protein